MSLDLTSDTGTPLDQQRFTWRELVPKPISKLDDDAFTRVRVILMNGIEHEKVLFNAAGLRFTSELRPALAQVMRVEHFQQQMVNWLLSPDMSPLETTIGYEQVAIEVTASVAQHEPDPYLAQTYRFAMLEDFDHLYRYSALLDRLEGKDANNILQSYSDIRPGRPTSEHHRAPVDDLREPLVGRTSPLISKLHAHTISAAELQTHDYYMNIGPLFADPVARALYAEIAAVEAQHTTYYSSLIDPTMTLLEQWLLHEANEVYNYRNCVDQESNPRIKAIWERFLDYELGHLHFVRELFKEHEQRDPAEILEGPLPEAIRFESQRDFVRQVLSTEVDMQLEGTRFVPADQLGAASREYRQHLNSTGSPSEAVAAGYRWSPGGEIAGKVAPIGRASRM
jgi:rubrerythrin